MAGPRSLQARRRLGESGRRRASPKSLPEEHKTCIYRVVQEALHNCVQHAGARKVTLTVQQQADRRLLLAFEDDGKGFDAPPAKKAWDCWESRKESAT